MQFVNQLDSAYSPVPYILFIPLIIKWLLKHYQFLRCYFWHQANITGTFDVVLQLLLFAQIVSVFKLFMCIMSHVIYCIFNLVQIYCLMTR